VFQQPAAAATATAAADDANDAGKRCRDLPTEGRRRLVRTRCRTTASLVATGLDELETTRRQNR